MIMKKVPKYKQVLKEATKKATEEFEENMKKQWYNKDDETLNEGDKGGEKDPRDDTDNL